MIWSANEVVDTSKENLYTVPAGQDWSDSTCSLILDQVQSPQKGKLKMPDNRIKGGEPTAKKKAKKKAAPKKAAKKKAAKKK